MDTENLPAIGTPEAAVHAIESLIYLALGAKEIEPLQLQYWLDAYYQARRAAEFVQPRRQPRTAEEIREILCRARTPAPTEEAEGAPVRASDPTEETEAPVKAKRQKPVGWDDGFEPVEIKKGSAAEAAAFKREQYERLQRFLREGVTMQQIVQAAEGEINEDQILGIRECKRVPVATYRVLAAALDRFLLID